MTNLLAQLKPFANKQHILVNDQQVSDIITGLLNTHNQYKSEYDKIAGGFKSRTDKETGKKIYTFLKNNVNYVIEPDSKQTLKSPAAILYTGKSTGSDCKNYSLFTGGILSALNRKGANIKWCYRFASYRMFDKMPHHVFVVINPNTANEIWVDAVLPKFNLKKQYYYKTDKKVNDMALVAVAGIGAPKKRQAKKAAKKAAAPAKKAARKELLKKKATKLKTNIKKAGKVTLKFAAAPVRNSFLLLVKLNFKNLAGKLQRGIDKAPDKIKTFWENAGGSYKTLTIAVGQGIKKKAIGVIGMQLGVSETAAAAAVTASPLLIKIAGVLKKIGIDPETIIEFASSKLKKVANEKLEQVNEQAAAETEAVKQEVRETAQALDRESGGDEKSGGTGLNKTLLIGGAVGVAALLFLTRKK
jgi:histone H1/5